MATVRCSVCKKRYDTRRHAFCPVCQDVSRGEGIAEYVCGHPDFFCSKAGKLVVDQNGVAFHGPKEGKRFSFDEEPYLKLGYESIKDVKIESRGQIENELNVGMVSTTGLAGFAFPKKEKGITYISIEYPLEDNTYNIVFGSRVGNELVDLAKSYLHHENKLIQSNNDEQSTAT